jgi:AAA+ ATPase superfamily predicted ATPase
LTVLLGPPSSGKTALEHVVEMENYGTQVYNALQIDLRGTSASSPDDLYETLSSATYSLFKRSLDTLTPSNLELKVFRLFICRSLLLLI